MLALFRPASGNAQSWRIQAAPQQTLPKCWPGLWIPIKTWVKVKLEVVSNASAASGVGGGAAQGTAVNGPCQSLARDVEDLENEFVESGLPQAM